MPMRTLKTPMTLLYIAPIARLEWFRLAVDVFQMGDIEIHDANAEVWIWDGNTHRISPLYPN